LIQNILSCLRRKVWEYYPQVPSYCWHASTPMRQLDVFKSAVLFTLKFSHNRYTLICLRTQ
jgi:hypothetical protein